MRRLHWQIYWTVVGVILLFALLASFAWWLGRDDGRESIAHDSLQALVEEALPPPGASRAEVDAVLSRLGERAGARLTVRGADGALLGAHGAPLHDLAPRRGESWLRGRDFRMGLALSDGRRVIALPIPHEHDWRGPGLGFLAILLSFVAALLIGAWPLARRLTRRLERLNAGVERLGGGDLSARVAVEGRDEVAALARGLNRAAERIEQLVEAQKQTLAAASHELRSPLGRLRMAFELLERPGADRASLRAGVERDIAELDDLIEELLLASRLDGAPELLRLEQLDLLGLAAEEAARVGAELDGDPCPFRGDERLLRRLIRNLLDNARRHGDGAPARITVARRGEAALLTVCNSGATVPEDERERIFEPFYRPRGAAERGDGAGLGLSLVRQIARRHGGDAVCRARREGDGACFEVTLRGVA